VVVEVPVRWLVVGQVDEKGDENRKSEVPHAVQGLYNGEFGC
jgi:hypothetical protein